MQAKVTGAGSSSMAQPLLLQATVGAGGVAVAAGSCVVGSSVAQLLVQASVGVAGAADSSSVAQLVPWQCVSGASPLENLTMLQMQWLPFGSQATARIPLTPGPRTAEP
jgi:hypothetical protein